MSAKVIIRWRNLDTNQKYRAQFGLMGQWYGRLARMKVPTIAQ